MGKVLSIRAMTEDDPMLRGGASAAAGTIGRSSAQQGSGSLRQPNEALTSGLIRGWSRRNKEHIEKHRLMNGDGI